MKRGRWILAIVLLMVGGSIAVVALRYEGEPEYQGKKMSVWLDMWGYPVGSAPSADLENWENRKEAVRHIGTNALPFLLRWIQYETPAWRKGLSDLAKKLGLHVPFLSAENVELYRAESAIMGFRCLGSDAEGAIPELLELTRAKYSMTQVRAGRALGSIGGESVPALLSMLTNRPALQGNDVAPLYWGWQCLGSDAILGVPVLVDQLKCTNGMVAGTSATLLGIGHVDGDVVVPALTNAVSRRDPWVRICALQGLCAFVEYEDVVTPVLVRALSDSDPNVRAFATNELRSFARPMVGGSGK